ncbi:hypothetical protein NRB13_19295, partial [Acinetobacter baumannii]|nr:hypothetical protein [Acinetobacter baumannii]
RLRECEIGKDYFQVANTKLMYSVYTENGAQLFRIESFDESYNYKVIKVEPMDLTVWLFHPFIETISVNLQSLYADLKDRSY